MMMVVTQLKSLVRRCHPAIPFSETTHVYGHTSAGEDFQSFYCKILSYIVIHNKNCYYPSLKYIMN